MWVDYFDFCVCVLFVCRVVVLGVELSGKIIFCVVLVEKLGMIWVFEYGCDFWIEKDGVFIYDDMLVIGCE